MIRYSLLFFIAALLSLSMGGSNFGASFAAAYGSRIVSRAKGAVLFAVFVVFGAAVLGRPVADTLSRGIVPAHVITTDVCIIILFSAAVSISLANLMHIPQSTSLVTVGAIAGAGMYFGRVITREFMYLLPFWIGLPVIGFVLTYLIAGMVYPPRKKNFWIYERIVYHKERLKKFVIVASCYNAFAVGTNNVANAAGPVGLSGIMPNLCGLLLFAPLFGLGGFMFHGPLKTAGTKIIPLGILTAAIICLVTGTLMIIASVCGVPQSFVMLKVASVFAVSSVKTGHIETFSKPVTKKTFITWAVTPIIAVGLSYGLVYIRYALFK